MGRIWISNYLQDAQGNGIQQTHIILDVLKDHPADASYTSDPLQEDPIAQEANDFARVERMIGDIKTLTMEERFYLLKLHTAGRKLHWKQAWSLTEPFLESASLCFPAAQWTYTLLRTVKDKDSYADRFDEFLKRRGKSKVHSHTTMPVVSVRFDIQQI